VSSSLICGETGDPTKLGSPGAFTGQNRGPEPIEGKAEGAGFPADINIPIIDAR